MNANYRIEAVNHYGLNVYDSSGCLVATAAQIDGLLCLDIVRQTPSAQTNFKNIDTSPMMAAVKATGTQNIKAAAQSSLWHRRHSHLGPQALRLLPSMTTGIPDSLQHSSDCDACVQCKLARKTFKPTTSRTSTFLDLVHSVLYAPLPLSIAGGTYVLLFITTPPATPKSTS